MNNEILNKAIDLKTCIYENPIIKEYLDLKEIAFKEDWLKKIKESNLGKCNLFVKANIAYEKMKKNGFIDPIFENLIILRKEVISFLEEIKIELDLWFIAF